MNGAPVASFLRRQRLTEGKKLRSLAEFLVVGVCTLALAFTCVGICLAVMGKGAAGTRDFVEYWASGQQLAHHANPYDAEAILRLERSVGLPVELPPMVMGNAPPVLLLVYPLGFLDPRVGELLWLMVLSACLVASVKMIRTMHGSPKSRLHFLGYTFAPALACVAVGQLSLLVLLGLVLFQRFHRERPFLAGSALWLCALKPQLFLPFGFVLLAWILTARCYRVLAGALSALIVSAAIAYLLDPLAWTQYGRLMSVSRYDKFPIPCVSIMLRRSINPNLMWLQYVPAVIGCIWALTYIRRHRNNWDWTEHGSPLILVSVLVAPYTWLIDQCILIPALLHGVYLTRSRSALAVLALASGVIELGPLRGFPILHSAFYLWTAPGWLAWYLYATRSTGSENKDYPLSTSSNANAHDVQASFDAVRRLENSEV